MATRKTSTRNAAQLERAKAQSLKETEEAVRKYLDLETLETRNSDGLDFHDMPVWQIREVARLAFEAGYAARAVSVQTQS
ncbi:MAG TPA: hypothetical protein VEB22_14665 [Phycisphaerales bacterium]|nr:hypothetical protein [Phycisphaerales bacterium]